MKRRDALKTLGKIGAAAAAASLLPGMAATAGCGDDGNSTPDAGPDAAPDAKVYPDGIYNYVFMMMENRSFDHAFGARSMIEGKPGNGPMLTDFNNDVDGNPVTLFHPGIDALCDLDPPHDWDSAHAAWNNGANDGFLIQHQMSYNNDITAQQPMQYLTRNEMPISYALADQYSHSDTWFCSIMGPTWPNRFYWHTGQSDGLITNELPTGSGGINWPSVYHRLQAKGIDWKYYYGSLAVVSLITDLDIVGKTVPFARFMQDCAAGTLPPVSYIDPAFYNNDDHPPIHPINGQELIATVYKALAQSPQWKNVMLVITYDENGGFFDHVSPPTTADDRSDMGFGQLGFRVPAIVAGPYIKEGYISSVQYDHTSALKHLQDTFDLDPLTARVSAANNLNDFIDMDRLAAKDWKPPIDLPDVDLSQWPMGDSCHYTGSDPRMMPGMGSDPHDIIQWADAHKAELGDMDRRAQIPEYRAEIAAFLGHPRKF
ncbi:MAG TPA: alkaline phosphatase family protein [Kofleriaceae bacterium]